MGVERVVVFFIVRGVGFFVGLCVFCYGFCFFRSGMRFRLSIFAFSFIVSSLRFWYYGVRCSDILGFGRGRG